MWWGYPATTNLAALAMMHAPYVLLMYFRIQQSFII
jgi:hypothetical protein